MPDPKFNWDLIPDKSFQWESIKSYKYRTTGQYQISIPIYGFNIQTEYVDLNAKGTLTVKKGYAWDGASGPTFDSKGSKRASCVHDAGYQLMRLGRLDYKIHRNIFDELFYKLLIADGMNRFRAAYWRFAVKRYAEYAARPKG